MSRSTNILCPVDLSDTSRRAIEYALSWARRSGAKVRVLEVVETLLPPARTAEKGVYSLTRETRAVLKSELQRFVEAAQPAGVPIDMRLREGTPAKQILAEVKRMPADLVVMGTHGRHGFDRLVLGSVTERVLRKANCHVLVMPPSRSARSGGASVKTILCATDFSEASNIAVDYALSLVTQTKGRLVLMHAVEWPFGDPEVRGMPPAILELRRSLRTDAQERLYGSVSEEMRKCCPLDVMVAMGKPANEIIKLARQRSADLIVMGVSGRHAVNLASLGSTTHRVIRDAPCPVLAVRSRPRAPARAEQRREPTPAPAVDEPLEIPDSPIGISSL